MAVGDSEDGAFWTAFLRSLRARGLTGVRLVISDTHEGLKGAIAAVLLGSAWQRCRVHFLRNVLARIRKGSADMVLAAIRTVCAQPDAAAVAEQVDVKVTKGSGRKLAGPARRGAHGHHVQYESATQDRANRLGCCDPGQFGGFRSRD